MYSSVKHQNPFFVVVVVVVLALCCCSSMDRLHLCHSQHFVMMCSLLTLYKSAHSTLRYWVCAQISDSQEIVHYMTIENTLKKTIIHADKIL